MPSLYLLVALVAVNLFSLRALSRFRARQQATPPGGRGPTRGVAPTPPPSRPSIENPEPEIEPVAVAFSVHGLPAGPRASAALQAGLLRLTGVKGAYVSPITAFAYIDYMDAEVTEEEIAQAIRAAGYQVGDASQRFDWRHRRTAFA